MKMFNRAFKLLASVVSCLLAGSLGSIATMPSIPTWYAHLNKPVFNPPNWIFGPVWTALYIMMGISFFLVWEKSANKGAKEAMYVFGLQLALNILWSFVFFGMKSPLAAFVVLVLLWASIVLTMVLSYRVSKASAWLLFPYILWVSFASILNLSIVLLN